MKNNLNSQVLVLAAGDLESNFNLSGFKSPKNLLKINGLPLLYSVIYSFISAGFNKIIVAIRKEEEEIFLTSKIIMEMFEKKIDCSIEFVFTLESQGPIATALLCSDKIDKSKSLIISSGDLIYVDTDMPILKDLIKDQIDCGLVTSNSFEDRWAYVNLDGDFPIEITPKGVISDIYAVGIYYFKSFDFFYTCAQYVLINMIEIYNYLHLSNLITSSKIFTNKVKALNVNKNMLLVIASPGDYRKFLKTK